MPTNHLEALKYTLQALAQPPEFQHRLLSAWREDVSELCERLVQAERHLAGPPGVQITMAQLTALSALRTCLESFSGPAHAEHWREDALDGSPCWAEVRRLAAGCLESFGWPVAEPPLEIAAYGEDYRAPAAQPAAPSRHESQLAAIERHYNLVLPAAYRLWASRGYLTFPSPHYLWVWEAEWIPLERVPGYQLSPFPHMPGLIPFAFTGGGDHWCWQTQERTAADEYCILRCAHDSDMATVEAPSFAGWFYRLCLDYAASIDEKERTIEQARQHLILWAERLAEIGGQSWADDLRRLAARSPLHYNWGPRRIAMHGFLTFDECQERVRQAFGQGYVSQEVPWQE
jgi:hypothetical protein